MNDLMIFEGNEVEIILNEKGEPLFEIYSTGMALGHIKYNGVGKAYPRKDRIDKIIENNVLMDSLYRVLKPMGYTLELQKIDNNYRLDAYVPELDLVIEYDENSHANYDSDKERSYNISKLDRDMFQWYKEQDFFSEERLQKIYEWQEYAYNKWHKEEII